jgi:sensor histidine kinase YesM
MKKSFVETKQFTVLLHVLIWSTFFLLQILSFQTNLDNRPVKIDDFGSDKFYYRFVFQSVIMISVYYLNSLILIPKLLFKNRITKYILLLIITLIVVIILDYIFSYYFDIRLRLGGKRPSIPLLASIFIIALSTSIKLAQKWFENESKQKEMIHEKTHSELSLLKSQVNPHFLFNTLNGIYSLANAKSDKTAPAIVKLSQMMRYMLDESKQQLVPLSSELDYINTYIDLQKLRLFDNVKIEFNIKGEAESIRIQPLLLIPFVENAFKHGTDSTRDCFINIDLEIKDNSIYLIVKNENIKSRDEDGKSGFGLNNIKRRLELEYPQKYVLNTEVVDNVFFAKLFISLK